jgi:3-oxoacyl-(acyl-carrier-protein) synthase
MPAAAPAIVITGLGLVTPWGDGAEAVRAGLADGRVALGPAGLEGPHAPARAGTMAAFDAKAHLGPKGLRSIDRVSRLALVAAQEALRAAGLAGDDAPRTDVGVVLGSAFSGLDSIMGFFTERLAEGANYVTASNFGNIVMNAAAAQVALRFGLPALNATVTSGAASGADALGWALDLLRAGRAPAALAGGVEELSAGSLAVLAARGRLPAAGTAAGAAATAARTFAPGEGAAFLMLEAADHAAARGARALAAVAGYGQAFDPGPAAGRAPDPAAAARAVAAALADAGLRAADVDLVVAAANGAADLDALEAAALAQAGVAAPPLAPKAWLGESLGAAGAIGAAIAALALDGAPVAGLAERPRVVLVDAFDADGHHAALVLRAADR